MIDFFLSGSSCSCTNALAGPSSVSLKKMCYYVFHITQAQTLSFHIFLVSSHDLKWNVIFTLLRSCCCLRVVKEEYRNNFLVLCSNFILSQLAGRGCVKLLKQQLVSILCLPTLWKTLDGDVKKFFNFARNSQKRPAFYWKHSY